MFLSRNAAKVLANRNSRRESYDRIWPIARMTNCDPTTPRQSRMRAVGSDSLLSPYLLF